MHALKYMNSLKQTLVVVLMTFGASVVAACLNPGLFALRIDLPPELGLNASLASVGDLPGYTYLGASYQLVLKHFVADIFSAEST